MSLSKGLLLAATVLFAVDFVLALVGPTGAGVEIKLLYLGLACFAGGHCIP